MEDWNYGAWLRAPLSNQIRKSTIVVPGFYQQKKESKVSKDAGSEPFSKSHQASLPENGVLTKPLEKVTLDTLFPNISNSAAYPTVRELEDPSLGFGEQLNTKRSFVHTLHENDAELEKGDMMEDVDGNLELFIKSESATSAKPGTKIEMYLKAQFNPQSRVSLHHLSLGQIGSLWLTFLIL